MSAVLGNILLSFVDQLVKPGGGASQTLLAIVSVLLSIRLICDESLTYPNAAPRITAEITAGVRKVYDVIIIGSGSSGSVLTGRLTAAGKSVLLIEAGGDPQPCSDIPKISYTCMMKSYQDWNYYSNDTNTCQALMADAKGRRCLMPRAKVVGGCSVHNLMYAITYWYGIYDLWVDFFGCKGWGSADIMKYFMKMEHYVNGTFNPNKNLGFDGPMKIQPFYPDPFIPFLNQTYNQNKEYQWVENINAGCVYGGYTLVDSTIKDCRRFSSAKAYIIPVKNRPNLSILKNSIATKILFDNTVKNKAIGVEFMYNKQFYKVYVKDGGPIISSAGVFGTPALLMLSGIGDADYLRTKGIECRQNLPVLRKYLWDHFGGWIFWLFDKTSSTLLDVLLQVALYMGFQTGPFCGTGTLQFVTFTIKNKYGVGCVKTYHYYFQANSLDLSIIGGIIGYQEPYASMILNANKDNDMLLCVYSVLDPKSSGWMGLSTINPATAFDDLDIFFNYLSDPEGYDLQALTDAMNFQLRLMNTNAFKAKNGRRLDFGICKQYEVGDNKQVTTDYMKCFLKTFGWSVFHPAGTCRMGANTTVAAVNAEDFRVFGFQNLFVCDASIVPTLPYCNLNLPCMAYGEKLSDQIIKSPSPNP